MDIHIKKIVGLKRLIIYIEKLFHNKITPIKVTLHKKKILLKDLKF